MRAGRVLVQWPVVSVPGYTGLSPQSRASRLSHPSWSFSGPKEPLAPTFRFERTGIFVIAVQGHVSILAFTNEGGLIAFRRNCKLRVKAGPVVALAPPRTQRRLGSAGAAPFTCTPALITSPFTPVSAPTELLT